MPSSTQGPVLVTGAAGSVGRAAVAGLRLQGIPVRGFDRIEGEGADEFVLGDLANLELLDKAVAGTRAIIHLAAVPDEDDFLTKLLPNNIVGLYRLLEAARAHGIQRVLLASTGQVVWWQLLEGPWPIRPEGRYSPRDWYAITKIVAESAGQAYARSFGMSVIAVRLGWFPRTREHAAELASTPRGPNIYLSPGDAGRFFARAVEARLDSGFNVVFVASRPKTRVLFDLEPAKSLLGWEPQDQWPTGAEPLISSASASGTGPPRA